MFRSVLVRAGAALLCIAQRNGERTDAWSFPCLDRSCGLAFSFVASAASLPGAVEGSAAINGFTVKLRAFPTVARLARPTSQSGAVIIGRGAPGTSPYVGTPLDGKPFLSMETGGSVTYVLKAPAASVSLIWSTPDAYNVVDLFDTKGSYIGVVTGADITKAFPGEKNGFFQIVSPAPIGSVNAFSAQCCFEVGNPGAMYEVMP